MKPQHPKLAEAAFFIELFEATQERTESLTRSSDLETEASYLFSAIVNAFYSALDQWRDPATNKKAREEFVKKNPEIYSHAHLGGWRSTTVHVQHIPITNAGYIPPKGGEVHLVFSAPPKLASKDIVEDRVDLKFSPCYYVEYKGELKEVVAFARAHLQNLTELIEPHEPSTSNETRNHPDA